MRQVRRAEGLEGAARAAGLAALPASEFTVAFADRARLVLEVVDGSGAVLAVAVVVEGVPTLSGAPVMVAGFALDEEAEAALADELAPLTAAPGGLEVMGPDGFAPQVTTRIGAATAGEVRLVMQQRLMVATDPLVPWHVPGWCRPMEPRDHDTVARWLAAFVAEALGGEERPHSHWLEQVSHVGHQVRLWERDGRILCFVNGRRTTPVSSRIGPVYTPPEHRGNGYAAACTAHVTRAALDAGDQRVILTTDVTNPTSNALYTRIGYVDVGPHASWWVGTSG